MATTNGAHDVKFYFDPVCPWAWRTSLWIREAAKVRPIHIEWRLFALDTANRAAGNPPREVHQQSLIPFRVMVLARRQHGPEVLDRLYLGFGRARHERKETINEVQVMERVLEEISFSAPDRSGERVTIDAAYVQKHIGDLAKNADLSRFIL